MRLRAKGIVPTYVRDTYARGHGRMLGKTLDGIAVVDDRSEEISMGECVTYLNDAVLMAPSMLLVPAARFTDADRTVRARAFIAADSRARRAQSIRVFTITRR